jgi:hypothetical protein
MRRLPAILLALTTLIFALITIKRATVDYNENGVYFDGQAGYDRDSVVAFGTLTVAFALLTLVVFVISRKRNQDS